MKQTIKMFTRILAGLLMIFIFGCATLFAPSGGREVEALLRQQDYTQAQNLADKILLQTEATKVPRLKQYYAKRFATHGWRLHQGMDDIDAALFLMRSAEKYDNNFLSESFLKKIETVKQAYAEHYIQTGEDALDRRDLSAAIVSFQQATQAANSLAQQAKKKLDSVLKIRNELKRELSVVLQNIDCEKWADAYLVLEKIKKTDISLTSKCNEYEEKLRSAHSASLVKAGNSLLEERQFKDAFKKQKDALRINRGTRKDISDLCLAIQSAYREHVKGDLETAIAEDNRLRLKNIMTDASELEMTTLHSEIHQLLAARRQADEFAVRAKTLYEENCLEEAALYYGKAVSYWPDNKKLGGLEKKVRNQVASRAFSSAQQNVEHGCALMAMLHCLKSEAFSNFSPKEKKEARVLFDATVEHAKQSIPPVKFSICAGQAGKKMEPYTNEDKVQKKIISVIPLGSPYLKTKCVSTADPINGEVSIIFSVNDFSTKTDKTTRFKNIRYVSNIAYDPNPKYSRLQAELQVANQELNSARIRKQQASAAANKSYYNTMSAQTQGAALTGLLGGVQQSNEANEATRQVQNARNKIERLTKALNSTSPTIHREIYSNYRCQIDRYSRRGSLAGRVCLYDPEGVLIAEQPLTVRLSYDDETYEAFPSAKLATDPLVLPDETEIRSKLARQGCSLLPEKTKVLIQKYWNEKLATVAKIKDEQIRCDRLLVLSFQNPSMDKYLLQELDHTIPSLPDGALKELKRAIAPESFR